MERHFRETGGHQAAPPGAGGTGVLGEKALEKKMGTPGVTQTAGHKGKTKNRWMAGLTERLKLKSWSHSRTDMI